MDTYLEEFNKRNLIHSRKHDTMIQYGTAGFRSRATDLDHIIFRMGLLATLRSHFKTATIGVMITASHNPEDDNGVKLVDPLGEMLEASWEAIATGLANVSDADLWMSLKALVQQQSIDFSQPANVAFARDTRPSSPGLAKALQDGIEALGGSFNDYGVLTTPQLHYIVRCINTDATYGKPTEVGYYEKLAENFLKIFEFASMTDSASSGDSAPYSKQLCIDGANGVGALKMKLLLTHLKDKVTVTVWNDGSVGKLNFMCGADYVKVQQRRPEGLPVSVGTKCVSFDGDADRIVYFFTDKDGKFHLLDGDKISTLVARYLNGLVKTTGLPLSLGVVQTAYANGMSTTYINDSLKIPVACVPTGVKHLHHKAQEFDIGVYFEANGHGTVLFRDDVATKLQQVKNSSSSSQMQQAAEELLLVMDLINQTVGDALSDLLLVEAILYRLNWSIETWNQIYSDVPNRQLKVTVKDRNVIQTTDAERKVNDPPALQDEIDSLVAEYSQGRSFVRPSGTEDVVRVYAEAATQEEADKLANRVSSAVHRLAGGVGDIPGSDTK